MGLWYAPLSSSARNLKNLDLLKRSDYLLFAIVTQENAYFVDVRMHPKPRDIEWARQDLLKIVHSNWRELIEGKVLRGVKGTILTNEEKHELRRKNCNHVAQLGDNAIAPIGGRNDGRWFEFIMPVVGIEAHARDKATSTVLR